jgi:hypothetical protein
MKALQDKIKLLEVELKEKGRSSTDLANRLSADLFEAQKVIKDLKAQENILNDRILKLKSENEFLNVPII